MQVAEWKSKGKQVEVHGRNLFAVEAGSGPETLVILHGYPTCSFDYWKVLPELAKKYRVIVHDHLGYGYSDKPMDYSYSLIEQAEFAIGLWEKLGVKKATIFAHDYGTSVCTEILARSQRSSIGIEIQGLILCNGSIHIELAKLRPIQKLLLHPFTGPKVAALASAKTFIRGMKNIWADPTKVSIEELTEMWTLLEREGGKKVVHKITQYIKERYRYWHRWIGALTQTEIPVKIVWATEDPVAVPAIANQLHAEIKNSELIWIPNTGHYPMHENPIEWTRAILDNTP